MSGQASSSTPCAATPHRGVLRSPSRKDEMPRTLFIASAAFLVFVGGFAASHLKLIPFLSRALNEGTKAWHRRTTNPNIHAARHDFSGVRAWDEGGPATPAAKPGEYILLTSYWPEGKGRPGLRVVDKAGHIVHAWTVPEAKDIWPERPELKLEGPGFGEIHGSYLFENGDVLFNMDYLGLVRLDAA